MNSLFDSFDVPIMQHMTQVSGQSAAFDHAVYALTFYDTFKGVILFSLIWLAWYLKPAGETTENENKRRSLILATFLGSVATVCIARIMQVTLHIHLRPIYMETGLPFPSVVEDMNYNTWNSFPSDHAMFFFALATGLWLVNKRIGLFAFLWTVFLVDLPRMYFGLHYPSDVIAGCILGILLMVSFLRIPKLIKLTDFLVGLSHKYPAPFYWIFFLATINAAHLFDDARGIGSGIINYLLDRDLA